MMSHHKQHILALFMMSKESAASVIMWKANHLEKTKYTLAYLKLELDMATDENKPTKCRGRVRGIISVWEEGRRENLWINSYFPAQTQQS